MQTGDCWSLEGRPKAESASRMPSLQCHFHVLGLPVQNFKFQAINFSQLIFLYLEASYETYENLHHSKISCYTVPRLLCNYHCWGVCTCTSWWFSVQTVPLPHQTQGWHPGVGPLGKWHQCSLSSLPPTCSAAPHSWPPSVVCQLHSLWLLQPVSCLYPGVHEGGVLDPVGGREGRKRK